MVPYTCPRSWTRLRRVVRRLWRGAVVSDKRQKNGPRFSAEWWAFWTMPIPETGCHIWMGCVCKDGYGRLGAVPKGTPQLPHRKAYEQFVGPIPDGLKVCHRCDVPSCVNPDHLFLGTQKDNLRDMFAKGRARPRGRAPGWREVAA